MTHLCHSNYYNLIILYEIFYVSFQVWFQNRRAKFRKQERLAQQKVTNNNSTSSDGMKNGENHKSGSMQAGNTTPKDIKPGSPLSTISTTPNSSASSHHSNGDIKPINGKLSDDLHINNNKWTGSCGSLLQQAKQSSHLSSLNHNLQNHHHAVAALSSPFSSLLSAGSAGGYLLDPLSGLNKTTAANHLF
uniref:CSON006722 protein n=1 Tax=Culicoides sonorensis TaxID=179676 RepID=A0A336MVU2_CULSO